LALIVEVIAKMVTVPQKLCCPAISLIGIGNGALQAVSSGQGNVGGGTNALLNTITGSYNTGFGIWAGQTIDKSNMTTGNNTFLGAGSAASTGTLTNATAIGFNAVVGSSNTVVLGCISGANNCGGSVNVGIGDISPGARLSVKGPESAGNGTGAGIKLTNTAGAGTNWYLRSGTSGTHTPAGGFSIGKDSLYAMSITGSGQVGIGTTTPNATLRVNGTGSFAGPITFASGQTLPGVAQLNSANTFTANQTVYGSVTATSFPGDGSGISFVNATELGGTGSRLRLRSVDWEVVTLCTRVR